MSRLWSLSSLCVGFVRGDSRGLRLGALVLATLVLALRGVPAWRHLNADIKASAAGLSLEAARTDASVAAHGYVADTLRTRKARFLALVPALVAGDSPAGAAATLASLVSGTAALSNLRVGALQVRADTGAPGVFVRVAVRGDVVGDIRGLTEFLSALECGPAMLRVRELSITQPEPAAAADRPEALRAEVVVEGLALNRTRRSPE